MAIKPDKPNSSDTPGCQPLYTKLLLAIAVKAAIIAVAIRLYKSRQQSTMAQAPWVTPRLHTFRRRRLQSLVDHVRGTSRCANTRTSRRRTRSAGGCPTERSLINGRGPLSPGIAVAYEAPVPTDVRWQTPAPAYDRIMTETPPPSYHQAVRQIQRHKNNDAFPALTYGL